MATVAKLTENGELKIAGNIDTRLPLVTDGLVAHYPFDGTTSKYIPSNIRYVRDWLNGSTANTGNHWCEVQVIDYTGTNRAFGLTATTDDADGIVSNAQYITDGNFVNSYASVDGGSLHYVELDLLDNYNIKTIKVRHYVDGRTYHETKVEVSEDGILWYSIFDSAIEGEYLEVTEGETYDLENLGNTVSPTIESNIIKNYDGINIEEGTTNKFLNSTDISNASWTKLAVTYTDGILYETDAISTKYILQNTSVVLNEIYTQSVLVKKGRGKIIQMAGSTGFSSANYVNYDVELGVITNIGTAYGYMYDMDNGWWKCVFSDVCTSTTSGRIVIGLVPTISSGRLVSYQGDSNIGIHIKEPMIELKYFGSNFTSSTTSAGQIAVHNPVTEGEYTVQFEVRINSRVGAPQSYMTIFSMGSYYSTNSWTIMDTNGTTVGGTQRLIRKGALDEWGWNNGNLTLSTDFNDFNIITVVRNATDYRVYKNGIYQNTIAHLSTTMQDLVWVGSRNSGGQTDSSTIKNLSFYNRSLTDKEILKNAKGTHSFTSKELITSSINSRPQIPIDAHYFDLGFEGKETFGDIIPSEDLAVYTDGDAYMTSTGSIEYNFYQSIGLDWNADWSICYFKKPIGTYLGETTLTGYNLESLGCNSNSVGGGYRWWGKTNSANTITSATNTAFDPVDYFEHWQCITVVKSGTTVTFETWLSDKLQRTRTEVLSGVVANYYETQYGYDFKLSGWDNNNEGWTHYKNLIVLKRAMTAQELNDFRLQKMKAYPDELLIQNEIQTGASL